VPPAGEVLTIAGPTSTGCSLLLGQSAFDYADPVLHEGNALLQVGLAFLHVQQSHLERLGLPDPLLQIGLRALEGGQPAGGHAQGQREHQKASDNNPQNDPSDHESHTTPGTQKQRAPHRPSRRGRQSPSLRHII
jgi:hypothetical protein